MHIWDFKERCLQNTVRNKLQIAFIIIVVLAVLHNIVLLRIDPRPDSEDESSQMRVATQGEEHW